MPLYRDYLESYPDAMSILQNVHLSAPGIAEVVTGVAVEVREAGMMAQPVAEQAVDVGMVEAQFM